MTQKWNTRFVIAGLLFTLMFVGYSSAAQKPDTQKWKVIHRFEFERKVKGADGGDPQSGLAIDSAGNLYGTTVSGGAFGNVGIGVVFELSPKAGGGWSETILYDFCIGQESGGPGAPRAGLVFDAAGNLYGTTTGGGAFHSGVVFELSPKAGGGFWNETTLHDFANDGVDGVSPGWGALVFDAAGNLYGTTLQGGVNNAGTVYELTPQTGGGWNETVLYSFGNGGSDGVLPQGGVVLDAAGNLYGATGGGGINNFGTVFEVSPNGDGSWSETILHTFGNPDAEYPGYGSLVFDGSGNLYGTTEAGGRYGVGAVYELIQTNGTWSEKVIHRFNPAKPIYGQTPVSGVVFGPDGDLYGTNLGSPVHKSGNVFRLRHKSGGSWSIQEVFPFTSNGHNGAQPVGTLMFDTLGNMYGTASMGGKGNAGVVFERTP